MKQKKKFILISLLIVAAGVLIGKYAIQKWNNNPNIIRVSGNIEITDAELSFKISGKVENRLVSEGETVTIGQVIARLDNAELVQQVALRRAELKAAQAALAELEAGSRPEEIAQAKAVMNKAKAKLDELLAGSRSQEIAAAKATLERTKADEARLRVDYERLLVLYRKKVISSREFDRAQSAYEMAKASVKEAEEHLKLIEEGPRKEQIEQARAAFQEAAKRHELVKKGPREETIEQARARVTQAKEALSLAETHLGYTILTSPLPGMVMSENVEQGEYVAPGTPVVTVGDLKNVWLRAYISETDLGRVKTGQKVRVTTDTYPGKVYEGHISFIASQAEFTPKNVQTQKERVKLVYRVKINIPNPNMELKPGMPADAEIILAQNR